jgi:hypothetical protein
MLLISKSIISSVKVNDINNSLDENFQGNLMDEPSPDTKSEDNFVFHSKMIQPQFAGKEKVSSKNKRQLYGKTAKNVKSEYTPTVN